MLATLTITRRRFSALSPLFCCALSLFLFFFSMNAEASFDDENIGRSLLQDHSSAHAEWHGMRMDERGEFWDRVGRHFDHGSNRREEEDGPLRWVFLVTSCILNSLTHSSYLSLYISTQMSVEQLRRSNAWLHPLETMQRFHEVPIKLWTRKSSHGKERCRRVGVQSHEVRVCVRERTKRIWCREEILFVYDYERVFFTASIRRNLITTT